MDRQLHNSGWALGKLSLDKTKLDRLIMRKHELLKQVQQKVEAEFNVRFTAFDDRMIEHIELTKAIVRVFLRYDDLSLMLAQDIAGQVRGQFNLSDIQTIYCTLPYPIIHFPKDTSEIGPRHKDAYDYIDSFYTTWTPLNDCFDKPISIVEKTHKKRGVLIRKFYEYFKFMEQLNGLFKKTITPDLKTGEFAVWNGRTDHEGLLNTTDKPTVALVVRFTSSPIMYEAAIKVDDLLKIKVKEDDSNPADQITQLIKMFRIIKEDSVFRNGRLIDIEELLFTIENNLKQFKSQGGDLHRLSFMLTLWAQRLEKRMDVSVFYLYALMGKCDNLYSLVKSLDFVYKQYGKTVLTDLVSKIIDKKDSIQVRFIIKDFLLNNKLVAEEIEKMIHVKNAELLIWSANEK